MSDKTKQACELLLKPQYFKASASASAEAIVRDYPHLAKSGEILRSRKVFQQAWRALRDKRLFQPASNSPTSNLQPSTSNPSHNLPAEQEEQTLLDKIELERDLARQRSKQREDGNRIKYLMKALDEAERRFEALSAVKENVETFRIEPRHKTSKNEAVSFACASDWHVEERVDRDVVNHLNHYDLKESSRRMKTYFQNVLRLVSRERLASTIDTLVLWLGGDLMTGYIHEELIESNYLSPIETVLFLKSHLISGIDFLLKEGGFKQILVPTNFGNHGRTGEKVKVGTGYKNSYEYMLYCDLADIYGHKREKRVKFSVAKGEFNFVEVFNVKIRTSHGYHIKYAGGVGGITIPAMKFIDRQNRIEKADYDVWGHHHQYFTNPFFCQNGSLIGVSAYGRRFGNEVPKQAYFTVDAKRGITTQMPIFVL